MHQHCGENNTVRPWYLNGGRDLHEHPLSHFINVRLTNGVMERTPKATTTSVMTVTNRQTFRKRSPVHECWSDVRSQWCWPLTTKIQSVPAPGRGNFWAKFEEFQLFWRIGHKDRQPEDIIPQATAQRHDFIKKKKNTWIPFTQGKLSSNVIEFQFLHTNKLRCGLRVCVDVSHRIPPHTYLPAPAVQQTARHPARSLRAATPLSDQIKPPRNDVLLCKTSAETLRKTERERERMQASREEWQEVRSWPRREAEEF